MPNMLCLTYPKTSTISALDDYLMWKWTSINHLSTILKYQTSLLWITKIQNTKTPYYWCRWSLFQSTFVSNILLCPTRSAYPTLLFFTRLGPLCLRTIDVFLRLRWTKKQMSHKHMMWTLTARCLLLGSGKRLFSELFLLILMTS